MNILGIDTSFRSLTVALQRKEKGEYLENRRLAGLRHGETLLPMIESLFQEASAEPADLDLLVCTRGPGSFTGLRIGLSTVKGLSASLGIPFAAVPTLDTLAAPWTAFPGWTAPILDARKGRIYTALYHRGQRQTEPADLLPRDFADLAENTCGGLPGPLLLTGPDPHLIPSLDKSRITEVLISPVPSVDGQALLGLGRESFEQNGPASPDCGPLYLRKSEAEIRLNTSS